MIELYEGVVAFKLQASGHQHIMLGTLTIGEISLSMDPRSQYPFCFRLELAGVSSKAWQPARDITDAKRQALEKINDWLIAAGLQPVRRAA